MGGKRERKIKKIINTGCDLFEIIAGEPFYCKDISVDSISFIGDAISNFVQGKIILSSCFSDPYLYEKNQSIDFDVVFKSYGLRKDYDKEFVIASFRDCRVISKDINDIVINDIDFSQMLSISVEYYTQIKIFNKAKK